MISKTILNSQGVFALIPLWIKTIDFCFTTALPLYTMCLRFKFLFHREISYISKKVCISYLIFYFMGFELSYGLTKVVSQVVEAATFSK